ncbi:hypothetical protein D3C86_1691180 [compost metagenome]
MNEMKRLFFMKLSKLLTNCHLKVHARKVFLSLMKVKNTNAVASDFGFFKRRCRRDHCDFVALFCQAASNREQESMIGRATQNRESERGQADIQIFRNFGLFSHEAILAS